MLDKINNYLESYIDRLYFNQNNGACSEQRNLFSKREYYDLLKPVVDLFQNSSLSLNEMRESLFQQSHIEELVYDFIFKKKMAPGLVFSYGTANFKETVVIGNRQEIAMNDRGCFVPALEQMTDETIFDLASVTKIFTSLSILKLVQYGIIDLHASVVKYAPEFHNLKDVTIFDLMTFGVPLRTTVRVDQATSKEEAEKILFDIFVDYNSQNTVPYTDMGAMVLKYVIEHVGGMDYYDFIDENILRPMGMKDTHVVIPQLKLDRVASTNFDGKYYKDGNFSINVDINKGIVYDPKARVMGQSDGNLSGHAGLFSTASDMTTLAKGIIDGQVISEYYVEMLAKNRTGRAYLDNDQKKYVQYLGMLCYSKHPVLSSSELFHAMSGKSFASAGWTGAQMTVDPINQLYFFMAGNRSHNRMTFIDPVHKDKLIVDESGKKVIELPNGEMKIDATRFAWERDAVIVHPSLKLCIQYKMLEDIYTLVNERVEVEEKIKVL